ncbi:jg4182 [Pararge aegeria aegeria]|uniref:Jg4182 protein n=1 Tax=Pararge aegeria aegeria TaxID=348720 RepID=A0A8S4SHY3_9NEOP|nr:jg4182 [Pararge aegeria aegeria]
MLIIQRTCCELASTPIKAPFILFVSPLDPNHSHLVCIPKYVESLLAVCLSRLSTRAVLGCTRECRALTSDSDGAVPASTPASDS